MVNNHREQCIPELPHAGYCFRINVVRPGKPEIAQIPNDISLWPAFDDQMQSNGSESNGVYHNSSETFAPERVENHRSLNGLAHLPLAGHSIADIERETIRQTLMQNDGNRRRSALILGISVRTLQRKLKQWNDMSP